MKIFRHMKLNEPFTLMGHTISIQPVDYPSISACLQCDAAGWCTPFLERLCRLGDMLYQTPVRVRDEDSCAPLRLDLPSPPS